MINRELLKLLILHSHIISLILISLNRHLLLKSPSNRLNIIQIIAKLLKFNTSRLTHIKSSKHSINIIRSQCRIDFLQKHSELIIIQSGLHIAIIPHEQLGNIHIIILYWLLELYNYRICCCLGKRHHSILHILLV